MKLELKIFLLLTSVLLLSNMLGEYLVVNSGMPSILVYFIVVVMLSGFLVLLINRFMIGAIAKISGNFNERSLNGSLSHIIKIHESVNKGAKFVDSLGDLVSDSIIVMDKEHKIVKANANAMGCLGKNIIGCNVESVISDSGFLGALKLAELNESELRINFTATPKNKAYKAVIKPYLWEGEVECFLIVMHDITNDLQLEERIQEFNINLSHEIKTPITAILSASETIIQDDFAREVSKEFVPIIHNQSRKLAKLVKDMDKLWENNVSKQRPIEDEVDLWLMVLNSLDDLRDKLSNSSISLNLKHPKASAKFMISGKERQIKELIHQMIENAIIHGGPNKAISLKISRVKIKSKIPAFSLNDGKAIKISVIDEGPGIDARHIKKITSTFYKADDSRATHKSNFGLGLAIVQKIVDRHKAILKINSSKGNGSKFSIYFPVTKKMD
ncbi:MAG: HAMP domain-containing histidine kinase [Candidatus Jidaibacter sp.]|jgi:two-component system phosphate regulon sensor histidine kinase PhoR|nr:HAMP domain-containing histidine kinase [Candidatus Jidaibacter sp.]